MFSFVGLCFGMVVRLFRGRRSLLLENLALRQQLVVLKRRHPRPSLDPFDKFFWVFARRVWSAWKHSFVIVTPETIVRWHRTGFRIYWRLISGVRKQVGRRPTSKEVRELIFRIVVENPSWGAPRIHGELRMLGFDLSERTISRWMKRAPRDPDRANRWLTFLHNHREAIAAMDFFTVPTITFGVLYCFFVIRHDRRRILQVNVTKHPTSAWITQQLREAFPFQTSLKYLIFDRDHRSDSEGCTIVTIERHSPDRLSAGPYIYVYMCAPHAYAGPPSVESSCCIESIIVFTPTPPRNARFGPRLKFWRTTPVPTPRLLGGRRISQRNASRQSRSSGHRATNWPPLSSSLHGHQSRLLD